MISFKTLLLAPLTSLLPVLFLQFYYSGFPIMRSRWTQYLSLDVHKFTGPEGLSAHYLKKVAVEIVVPLTFLYKKSLQQGIVPQALSSPIHKSGSVDEPST